VTSGYRIQRLAYAAEDKSHRYVDLLYETCEEPFVFLAFELVKLIDDHYRLRFTAFGNCSCHEVYGFLFSK